LGGRGVVGLAHGVVELPNAGETGREGNVGEVQACRFDQDPRRMSPLYPCQRERTCPELFGK
jgi:hypothetical protein